MKTVKAKICWIDTNISGKKIFPSVGTIYSTMSWFEDIPFSKEAWSIVAEILTEPDDCNCVLANIRFLVDCAPEHLLYKGSKFQLFESKVVATGYII